MQKTIIILTLALLFTVPTFAQSRRDDRDPYQKQIDEISNWIVTTMDREGVTEYHVATDGRIVINGRAYSIDYGTIPRARVRRFIRTDGCWSDNCGTPRRKR